VLTVNCWYSFPYVVGDFEDLVAKTDVHISVGHRLEVLQGMGQECMTALSISCLQRYTHIMWTCSTVAPLQETPRSVRNPQVLVVQVCLLLSSNLLI
jgi:hypothetical protein